MYDVSKVLEGATGSWQLASRYMRSPATAQMLSHAASHVILVKTLDCWNCADASLHCAPSTKLHRKSFFSFCATMPTSLATTVPATVKDEAAKKPWTHGPSREPMDTCPPVIDGRPTTRPATQTNPFLNCRPNQGSDREACWAWCGTCSKFRD